MSAVKFIIPGAAVGKGRPRAAKRGKHITLYTPKETASYENLVKLSAAQAMGERAPMDCAVDLELYILVAPPASWSQKKRLAALSGEIRPTSKPDADNVLKAIADACNGIVWDDDKQIADLIVRKAYAAKAETLVIARPCDRAPTVPNF